MLASMSLYVTTQLMAERPLAKCHDLIVCVLVPEQRAC